MGEFEFKDPFVGRVIGAKYEVVRRLGTGGMGAVYKARHLQTGGDIALKFLHGTAAADEAAVRRFQVEAQNAAALRHANTIRVTDFGVDDGTFYLTMEYLEGRSLAEIVAEDGPLPWPRVVRMARQILKALWEAHEHPRRIIHRDIKPANIFVVDLEGDADHVRVLDFGVSRALAASGAGTQGLIGTPLYMAPEMWRGGAIDGRTDLYALGCVVYQMLAGAPPFVPPPSAPDVLYPLLNLHLREAPPELADAVPEVPPALAAWVARLMAKDPSARPASARAALEELDAIPTTPTDEAPNPSRLAAPPQAELPETVDARPTRPPHARALRAPPPRPVRTSATRSKTPPWLVATVALVLVGGLAGAIAVAAGSSGQGGGATTLAADPEPIVAVAEPDDLAPAAPEHPAEHPTLGSRVFTYLARLSEGDHLDAYGQQIITAPGVLVRDRERLFSALAMGSPGADLDDESDPAFRDADARALFGSVLGSALEATVAHVILTHTPLVRVTVYEDGVLVDVVGKP